MDRRFLRAEAAYWRLRTELASGQLTAEQFDGALRDQMVWDGQGRPWSLGPDSGEWYIYQNGEWAKATPPAESPTAIATQDSTAPARPVPQPTAGGPWADGAIPEFAGFWWRAFALLIDWLILSIGAFVISGIAELIGLGSVWEPVVTAGAVLYVIGFTAFGGQTPGKMMLAIRVITRAEKSPGLLRAVVRETIGKFASSLVLFVGFLWVLFHRQKRGWHDFLAGTYVVRL